MYENVKVNYIKIVLALFITAGILIYFFVQCQYTPIIPDAPITKAPTVTSTFVPPTHIPTRTLTPTWTRTLTMTPLTPTGTPSRTPTVQPPTVTPTQTTTMPPLPQAGLSEQDITRIARTPTATPTKSKTPTPTETPEPRPPTPEKYECIQFSRGIVEGTKDTYLLTYLCKPAKPEPIKESD